MSEKSELQLATEKLAYLREVGVKYGMGIAQIEEEMAQFPAGMALIKMRADRAEVKNRIADAEEQVRTLAMAAYVAAEGDKKPHPAVQVKIYTVLEYSQRTALQYIRKNLPVVLKADWPLFERIAKTVGDRFGFVSETLEPRVTIARKLDKWLPEEAPADLHDLHDLQQETAEGLAEWYLARAEQIVTCIAADAEEAAVLLQPAGVLRPSRGE